MNCGSSRGRSFLWDEGLKMFGKNGDFRLSCGERVWYIQRCVAELEMSRLEMLLVGIQCFDQCNGSLIYLTDCVLKLEAFSQVCLFYAKF